MHLYQWLLLIFTIFYLVPSLITYYLLKQKFSADIANWKKSLANGISVQLEEKYIIYKEEDIVTYMHRRGRWAILFGTLFWFLVIRPLIIWRETK